MKKTIISVVLVDDHHLLRLGISNLLGNSYEFQVVGEADDGLSGLRVIEKTHPDVVVLDISMEGLSGIDMIKPIRSSAPKTRIIIYSMHDDPSYICKAMQTGCSGYVLKSDPVEELVTAIKEVDSNQTYLSSTVTASLVNSMIINEGEQASLDNSHSSLTSREKELSSLIAKGYNTQKIADALFISPKTVRVHRANIMKKLSCKTTSELTVQLRDHFYSSIN
ncbi:MAG: response regulator transcription factor [Desulfocapsa sp.]|nr:response regulator transcription factor [Desulfocapsa sp.]